MNPERWRQIERIYNRALELERAHIHGRRAVFVAVRDPWRAGVILRNRHSCVIAGVDAG